MQEYWDLVTQIERRKLARAGEQSGRTHQRDRAHAAEERAAADRDRLGFACDADVPHGVVGRDAVDQRRNPIVRQRRRQRDAGFLELLVNLFADVHGSRRTLPSNIVDYATAGPAAMTSTSTKNSGREKPPTIIRVDAGGGSLMNWSRAAI